MIIPIPLQGDWTPEAFHFFFPNHGTPTTAIDLRQGKEGVYPFELGRQQGFILRLKVEIRGSSGDISRTSSIRFVQGISAKSGEECLSLSIDGKVFEVASVNGNFDKA